MAKWTIKSFALAVFMSWVIVTIINLLLHQILPEIPIIKTGFALLLLLAGVVLSMLFVIVVDKQVNKLEIQWILLVLAISVGLFFAVKNYIPELFSILPASTKQVFSAIIP